MRIQRDGSLAHAEGWEHLKYPKNSLSAIGHIAKMAQILYWAQLWFGLGAFPEHEPRARVLSESRTRQFSGSRSRVTNNGFIPYPFAFILFRGARLFAFFPLSALIIHPCRNAPEFQ
jgi:hypothetical protein